MKAIVTCYKPGYKEDQKEVWTKNIFEYTAFLLRAGKRGYEVLEDERANKLFIIRTDGKGNQFEVKFEF